MRSRTQQNYATSEWQGGFPDLVTLLRTRAQSQSEHTAYLFLEEGEKEGRRIGFDALDRRARSIAAHLQDLGVAGQPALLLYPPGLDYIEAFFACLYAGAIAVPAYPPSRHHVHRLHAVVRDASPALVMTTADLHEKLRFGSGKSWTEGELVWLATDTLGTEEADAWAPHTPEPESLAFLQYTSGSTGNPRGVMVTHANLLANQELIKQSFQHTEESTVVGWLPIYHDMGLIGNILQPLYVGSTAVLMSPLAFLEKPIRWLQSISTFRACTSGGPNFAYELCVRKITAEQKHGLDLSGWTLAFNGSEPVRATTLERFAAAFAECGFSPESFFPCYGLAEATLFVTGPPRSRAVRVRRVDKRALGQHRVAVTTAEPAVTLVGCGHPWRGHEVRIVDPETRMPCSNGEIGEIWVAGASVAQGYWKRPEESERTFRAKLVGESGRFLRTGDLGFVDQGELYITGRSKDLIIIRGRNYYPQDFERVLDEQVDVLRPGCNAVFSITIDEQELLVIVAEVQREHVQALRKQGVQAIFQQIRERLTDECDIAPAEIVLVPPGSIPKTSSGKIRRQACRQAYSDDTLRVLARSGMQAIAEEFLPLPLEEGGMRGPAEKNLPLLGEALRLLTPAQRAPLIARWLASKLAQLLRVPETSIALDQPLCSLGFDSLQGVEFKHAVEELLGASLPLARFLSDATLTELAEELAAHASAPETEVSTADDSKDGVVRLSYLQEAIFTVHRLDPESIAYNLHLALGIKGHLDQEILKQSVARLVEAHPVLRTVYRADGITMSAATLPTATECFSVVEAAHWSERQVQEDFTRRSRAPFDLEHGPVIRLTLYAHGNGRYTLLCCAHHIALDLWSVLILIEQLPRIYGSMSSGWRAEATTVEAGYRDFVRSQREYVASEEAETAFAYWRSQLSGELPLLALPTDYSKANSSSNEGASHALRIGQEFTAKLKALARGHGVTLFMILLAAYKVLLYRYTHQTDIIVGAPSSGRTDRRYAPVVGNFVNPVAVRTYPSPELPFTAYLQHVREAVLGALTHEQFPFSLLVERLQPKRHGDEWPIYQTMFVLQQAQSGTDPNLSQLALGEDGAAFSIGEWQVHPIAIQERVENFDLKLMAAECEQGLIFSFQYRRELFRQETIAQIAAHFEVLLRGIVANPNTRLAELPLLPESERHQLLVEWNATGVDYPKDKCVHQLFEVQVERAPEAPALLFGDECFSYRELNRRANRLALALHRDGVGPDAVVGLCARRSAELVVGLLGILKAGGAYLPLDPDYPQERLASILADSGTSCVLVQAGLETSIPVFGGRRVILGAAEPDSLDERDANLGVVLHPLNLAYVLYTSGSTGKPKGVAVPHAGICNRLLWMQAHFALRTSDTVLQKTPYTFDVSVWEFFWPLLAGARLVVAGPEDHKDPTRLIALIERHAVTTLHFVPSMLRVFLEDRALDRCRSVRTVICSGEALDAELCKRFYARFATARLYNLYGPTEASIDVTAWACERDHEEASVPIGQPIANTRIHLLDSRLNPVPIGIAGELYIGGVQLARGYLHRPELTAAAFVPDLFGDTGERLYRTGDLARWRSDGAIEYLGRIDHQVKVRGFRIELGEIETRLMQHPIVKKAAVIAREEARGERRLVAYVVVAEGEHSESETIARLNQHLRETLPDYMIPAAYVFLDAFPYTSSGKLDRKALPPPDVSAQFAHQYVAPRNSIEATLARIWADVLLLERVGVHDNFFTLGGDSVRSIQMVSRAHESGVQLTPRQVFQHPTVADLAQFAEATGPVESLSTVPVRTVTTDRAYLTPADFPLASLSQQELDALPFEPRDIEDIYPLGPMQEGMLFHSLAQPGSGVYVMQDRYALRGTIDVQAFSDAWQAVVDHHPILRTTILWETESRAHQIVHRQVRLPFEFHDWRALTESEQRARLETLLQTERAEGFDLSSAPLMRVRLFRFEEQRYICVRSFHHIVMDEWCTSPLLLEFRDSYQARLKGLPIPHRAARPFSDYIAWLQHQDITLAKRFWRAYLEGFSEPTPLVVERPGARAERFNSVVDDMVVALSALDTERLNALARQHGLTVNTFVQGALALLLAHYSGRVEVVFGVTVAGRPTTLPGVESTIGLFINSLPLRVRIRPDIAIRDWLKDLLVQNLELRQYEHVPLVKIQSWSAIPRAEAQVFQHLLTFENAPIDPSLRAESDVLDMDLVGNRIHTNYPITFVAIPASKLLLRLTYERERFERATMERMLGHVKWLLEGVIHQFDKRVGEIGLLDSVERRQILDDWNATEHEYAEPRGIIGRFEAQVAKTPEAIAVVCGDARLTYRELNARANRVAHGLTALGVGPDALVALLDDRGVDFLVMMLGIFKAGGAYVPLDPAHPDGRMVQVLEESRVQFLLCGETYRARAEGLVETAAGPSPTLVSLAELEAREDAFPNPPRRHTEQNLAFVIYTSGSTGKPKGAMVEHRGMFNNLITKVPALELTGTDVIAQTASQCFDISVWQYLTALTCGARVEVFPDKISHDPARLLEQLAARGVTILETVPSMIRALLEIADASVELPALRWLMPCGEAFPPELCRQWMQRFPELKLLNAYGPAECSDDVSYHPIEKPKDEELTVPIGRPVDNTRLYILNRWLEPVPIGVPGEICVGGIQVGRGYLNRVDLTAAAFIPDPFGDVGERLYRTGDLGRYRSDGVLEFLGRIDHQVKIRGHRIEPGEIEACLVTHPEVREACVVPREVSESVYRLVAYVVGAVREVGELRAHILKTLPEYMVPAAFVFLEALPLTPNGKVDRKRLPDPDIEAQLAHQYVAPRNATEETLATIWAEVLRVERVGVHDNFFELGGDSILSIQIVSRARRAGLAMTPRNLFEHQQISTLATIVEPVSTKRVDRGYARAKVPLTPIQRWYFKQDLTDLNGWNQAVLLEVSGSLNAVSLQVALREFLAHHDALCMRFVLENGEWQQFIHAEQQEVVLHREDLPFLESNERTAALSERIEHWRNSLDIVSGSVLRVVWFESGSGHSDYLLVVIHRLVIDAISWRIFLEDLHAAYEQAARGERIDLPPKTASYCEWVLRLHEQTRLLADTARPPRDSLLGHDSKVFRLPVDYPEGADAESYVTIVASLDKQETRDLTTNAVRAYHTDVSELLVAGLALTLCARTSRATVGIDLETHGREHCFEGIDLSRTIGWFAAVVPVVVSSDNKDDLASLIKRTKEVVRESVKKSIDVDLERRVLSTETRQGGSNVSEFLFRYVGSVDASHSANAWFSPIREPLSLNRKNSPEAPYAIQLDVERRDDRLQCHWQYSTTRYSRSTIEKIARDYLLNLLELVKHCLSPEAGGYTPSDFPLAELNQRQIDDLSCKGDIEDIYPLTPMQEGMLFHTLLNPHTGIYLMQERYVVRGTMHIEAFRQAWQDVVDHHPIFRTAFVWGAEIRPHQIAYRNVALHFTLLDWRECSESEQWEKLETLLRSELSEGFDFNKPSLLRVRLIKLDEDSFYFTRSYHHILMDAWSLSLLMTAVLETYECRVRTGKPNMRATRPYRDYIAWLKREDRAAAEAYWREYLQGFESATPLVADRLLQEREKHGVADHFMQLTAEQTHALSECAQKYQLTPNTFVQGAWALTIAQYSNRHDVLFGVTVAGRPASLEGCESVIGLFINTVPLRVRIDPSRSLTEWLVDLLDNNLRIRQYEYTSLVDVQAWSDIPKGSALFQSFVVFENAPIDPSLEKENLKFKILSSQDRVHTNYPLAVEIVPDECLILRLTYDRGLFESDAVAQMLRCFHHILCQMIAHPDRHLGGISVLREADRHQVHDWNITQHEYAEPRDLIGRFEAQVEDTPKACAVTCGEARLTYRELNLRANCVAEGLSRLDVGPDTLIALLADRGVDFLVMMLGIFKAGGAYVPLDPAHPDGRMVQVLEESRARFMLCGERYRTRAEGLIATAAAATPTLVSLAELEVHKGEFSNPPRRHTERNLAFVIYTSGSTGKPKGAMVEHRGMFNNLITKVSALGLTAHDVIAQTASQCFDISVWQYLTALTCGARVEVFPDEISRDPARLLEQLAARGVTILETVPSMIRALLEIADAALALPALRWLLPCGEAFPPELCRQWMQRFPNPKLLNAYGPAECSDDVSYHPIERPKDGDLTVPIGRPVDNTRLYLLNRWLEPVPVGVPGEICVGGVQVGRGYLNRADLTAAAFIPDPFGDVGERLYRTGDLGRYRADGVLEFLGRIDHQVKIRGHRIEPGEIEACLLTHPEVREACVVPREVSEGIYRLVAYVVGTSQEVSELRAHILKTLPEYMVPSAFVFLESLPLTPNGKVDRKRLPDPDIEAQMAHQYVAPRNPTEATLANIWAEVLHVERVGIHDNFFELGGHSLLATQIASRIRTAFAIDLPLRTVFEITTVAGLAEAVDLARLTNKQAELNSTLAEQDYEDILL